MEYVVHTKHYYQLIIEFCKYIYMKPRTRNLDIFYEHGQR